MDLILSCSQQTLCHRIVRFAHTPEWGVFPSGWFDDTGEALEVGPHRNHKGPGLVAMRGVLMAPPDAAAFISSHPSLGRIVQRVMWVPRGGRVGDGGIDGNGSHAGGFSGCSGGAAPDEAALAESLRAPGALPAGLTGLRVLSSPSALASRVAALLDPSVPLQLRCASHVLCIVRLPAGSDVTAGQHGEWAGQSCPWAGQPYIGRPGRARMRAAQAAAALAGEGEDVAAAAAAAAAGAHAPPPDQVPHELRWAVVPTDWVWIMPPEAEQPFAHAPGMAVRKLDESLRLLGVLDALRRAAASSTSPPWAVDLGAAPGAWTQHLAGAVGFRVAAVDPGALAPAVLALPGVRHVRARSEHAVAEVAALVRDRGGPTDGGDDSGAGAELLVSDMNMHPMEAVKVVRPLLSLVRPGGLVVLTLKMPGSGRDRTQMAARVTEKLGDAIDSASVRCVWLFANTSCERTLFARRKAAPVPPVPSQYLACDAGACEAGAAMPSAAEAAAA